MAIGRQARRPAGYRVRVTGPAGKTLRVNLSPQEQYEMTVRIFDGNRLVAEQSARHP
jgi:hypothetical protein